jgi:hypothetical protein
MKVTQMNNIQKTTSSWNIVVPVSVIIPVPTKAENSARMSDEDFADFKLGVEEMLEACTEANLNERLVNVITACIEAGLTTAGAIIATSMTFGFSRGHVGSVLSNSTAGKSKDARWRCDSGKQYSLLS